MSIFKRSDGSGTSAGKVGGLGAVIVAALMAILAVVRGFGVELPVTDDQVRIILEALVGVLVGLGVFGIRRAME